jgi:hypothetical protein
MNQYAQLFSGLVIGYFVGVQSTKIIVSVFDRLNIWCKVSRGLKDYHAQKTKMIQKRFDEERAAKIEAVAALIKYRSDNPNA